MVKINISHDSEGHLKIELQTQAGQPLDFVFNQPMGSLSAALSSSPLLSSYISSYNMPDGIYHMVMSHFGDILTPHLINNDTGMQAPIFNLWNAEPAIQLLYQASVTENHGQVFNSATYHVHHVEHNGADMPMLIEGGSEAHAPSWLQSASHFLHLTQPHYVQLWMHPEHYTPEIAAIVDPQLDPANALPGTDKSVGWPGCIIS